MHRRRYAAAALAVALPLALGGCFNGYQAQTTAQTEGGDTASANVGDVQVRGLIWVRDRIRPELATLTGSFMVTETGKADELQAVVTKPTGNTTVINGPVAMVPGGVTRVGYNSDKAITLTGAEIPASSFIQTTLVFKTAGAVTVPVLIVPATGIYADVTVPSSVVAGATSSPSASASKN